MCFVSALATEGCSLFTGIRYTRSVKEAMNSVVWVPLYPGWPKKGTFKRSSFSAVWSVIISCIIVCPREERIPRAFASAKEVCVCGTRESFSPRVDNSERTTCETIPKARQEEEVEEG